MAVGIGTALADDPELTARDVEPAPRRQPLRIVFDRAARLPLESALVRSASEHPVLVVCAPGAPGAEALHGAGVETLAAADLAGALAELGRRGVSNLLLEGGPRLAGAMLEAGLIDRVALFAAPLVLGDGGRGLLAGWRAPGLERAPRAVRVDVHRSGADILIVAEMREP